MCVIGAISLGPSPDYMPLAPTIALVILHQLWAVQWLMTRGSTHAIPLPNLFTKRVPIT